MRHYFITAVAYPGSIERLVQVRESGCRVIEDEEGYMRYRVGTAGSRVSRSGEWKRRQRSVSPQLRDFSQTLQGPLRPTSRSSNLLPPHLPPSDSTPRRPCTSASPSVSLAPAGLTHCDIEDLFRAKCLDLSVEPTSRQLFRFREYCRRHINRRQFAMPESGLSLHSAPVVARIVGNNFHFAYVNLSRNLLGDKGVAVLVRQLANCVNLVHLDVSSNDMSPAGAQQALSVLSSHKSLTSLDLSSHEGLHRNRLNLPGAEALRAYLQASPFPTHVNVTGTALGSEGCEVLAVGVGTSRTLLALSVGNNGINAKGVEILARVLAASTVKLLGLAENSIGGAGCEAISRLLGGAYGRSTLQQLDLSKCDLNVASLQRLTPGCHRTSSLTLLRLDGNPLGTEAGFELLQLLLENRSIQDLGLASCRLRSGAVSSLADGLARNSTLYRLNLAYNHFEDQGALHLAAALRLNSTLKCLDLSGNNVRNKGAGAIGQALIVNCSLETLFLRDNNVEDVGGKALALGSWRSRALVHLDLDLNSVHIHFLREIARNLGRNKDLKLKSLTPCLISEVVALATTPQAAQKVAKDLESKQMDKTDAEKALSAQQIRLQSVLEEEESRYRLLESDLEVARKRSAACTKEMWEVREAITGARQQGDREVEKLHRDLEVLSAEVRGLEKTAQRLKGSFAMRRVEAMQRLAELDSLKAQETAQRSIAREHLERLHRELELCKSPLTPSSQRPVLPRQSLTPQPRRRRYYKPVQ